MPKKKPHRKRISGTYSNRGHRGHAHASHQGHAHNDERVALGQRLTAEFLQGAAEALRTVGIEAIYMPHPTVLPEAEGWVYFEPGQQEGEHQCFHAGHNLGGSVFLLRNEA